MKRKIFLIGAGGGTGRAIMEQALERGYHICGAERDLPADLCSHDNFEGRDVNVLEDNLADAMQGCDAVISAIGLGRDPQTLIDPPPLYTEGAVRILDGMRGAKIKRLIVISAAFAARDVAIPAWFKAASLPLRHIFRQMAEMERVLRASESIEWTAVRPGWLLDRELTGQYRVDAQNLPPGTLRTRRADLAHFMLDCLDSDEWVRKMPFIASKEAAALEGPSALIEEFSVF